MLFMILNLPLIINLESMNMDGKDMYIHIV